MIRKIGFGAIGVLAVLIVLATADLLVLPIRHDRLDFVQRFAVDRINAAWQKKLDGMPKEETRTVGYDGMLGSLNFVERGFARRILAIDPVSIGFKGPAFSKDPVSDLVMIPAKQLVHDGAEIDTGINYVPAGPYADFERMMEAMNNDLGKRLYVESGYRSPGYQAYLFFKYLGPENGYSLDENAKWIAMPGYSEHGSPDTALDLINQDGISGQDKGQAAEDFSALPEYAWLSEKAAGFNFYQTYPKDNHWGVSEEPWHWHWQPE